MRTSYSPAGRGANSLAASVLSQLLRKSLPPPTMSESLPTRCLRSWLGTCQCLWFAPEVLAFQESNSHCFQFSAGTFGGAFALARRAGFRRRLLLQTGRLAANESFDGLGAGEPPTANS